MTMTPEMKQEHDNDGQEASTEQENETDTVGNYQFGKDIGKGSFGMVKLATHVNTGETVAVKIMNKAKILQQGMKEKVAHEIDVLKNIGRHKNIAPLYDVIDSPTDTFLILENIDQGDLYDYLVERGTLDEEEARDFFEQLIDGIEHIHSKDIAHRDLKLDNLLLDSDHNLRIADFGLSARVLPDNFLKTTCGTPHYVAPEILSRKEYHGTAVDIWSSGIILYAFLCGTVPFNDENTPQLFEKIQSGDYEVPNHVSESARDLLSRILEVDPTKRITIPEIRQHPWFLKQKTMPKKHHHKSNHAVIGDGVTDNDPLDQYLSSSPKQTTSPLDDISESIRSVLSHESYFTCEPMLEHDEERQENRHHSTRSHDDHNHHKHHHHHRRWLFFPHWHTKHHHDE